MISGRGFLLLLLKKLPPDFLTRPQRYARACDYSPEKLACVELPESEGRVPGKQLRLLIQVTHEVELDLICCLWLFQLYHLQVMINCFFDILGFLLPLR